MRHVLRWHKDPGNDGERAVIQDQYGGLPTELIISPGGDGYLVTVGQDTIGTARTLKDARALAAHWAFDGALGMARSFVKSLPGRETLRLPAYEHGAYALRPKFVEQEPFGKHYWHLAGQGKHIAEVAVPGGATAAAVFRIHAADVKRYPALEGHALIGVYLDKGGVVNTKLWKSRKAAGLGELGGTRKRSAAEKERILKENGLRGLDDILPIERAKDRARYIIRDAAARAFFVDDWASAEEEAGNTHGGEDLMEVAPPTSPEATAFATRFIDAIEKANHCAASDLLVLAAEADGRKPSDPSRYAQQFGHYLAMMALGHGVSWFDDHERFDLYVPDAAYGVISQGGYSELGPARDRA